MFTAELTEGGLAQECFDVKVGQGLEIPVLGSVTQTDLSFAFLSQYLIADLPIEYCRGLQRFRVLCSECGPQDYL